MENKGLIWVVVGLAVLIVVVFFIQSKKDAAKIAANQQQSLSDNQLAMQILAYRQNAATINSNERAGTGDWLKTISSISGAVASIFGAGPAVGAAASAAQNK